MSYKQTSKQITTQDAVQKYKHIVFQWWLNIFTWNIKQLHIDKYLHYVPAKNFLSTFKYADKENVVFDYLV